MVMQKMKCLLVVTTIIVILSGCFGDSSTKKVENANVGLRVENDIAQSFRDGGKYVEAADYTYIPADGSSEAYVEPDFAGTQGKSDEYHISLTKGNNEDIKQSIHKNGDRFYYGFSAKKAGEYKLKVNRGDGVGKEVTIEAFDEKQFVYKYLKDSYLWNDTIIDFNPETCLDTNEILNRVKSGTNNRDRWSGIISKKEFENMKAGVKDSYGFIPFYLEQNNKIYFVVGNVDKNSPFDEKGIKRGDIITAVNGKEVSYWAKDGFQAYYELINGNEKTLKFKIIPKNKTEQEYTITKKEYVSTTVPIKKIFTQGNKKIGYILFTHFDIESIKELDEAGKYFTENKISDIVVDLRYNGGGDSDTANYFGSMLAGKGVQNKIFMKRKYNNNYKQFENAEYFSEVKYPLELENIVFLTTVRSVSASEVLINSLKPYKKIITVGQNSNGKFVGYEGISFFNSTIFAVNVASFNANDETGDYTKGITPDIYANDNLSYDFGDENEDSIKTALSYITSGIIPVTKKSDISGTKQIYKSMISEKDRFNDIF